MHSTQHQSARTKVLELGVRIPKDTPYLRLAIKRELWMRRLTTGDLSKRLGVTERHATKLLAEGASSKKIYPGMLDRIIAVLHITPAVARRLHLLGAQEAGWKVDGPMRPLPRVE